MRPFVQALKQGRSVAMIMDRRIDQGTPIPFFGADKPSSTLAARLALKFGCPLVPVKIERRDGPRFRVTFLPPLQPAAPDADQEAQARDLTRQIHGHFEQWITERPGAWFCSKKSGPVLYFAAVRVAMLPCRQTPIRTQPTGNTAMPANRPASAQSREQSIRLFDNPVLESLSHVHPIMPLLVWLPVAAWLLVRAVTVHGIGPVGLAGIGIAGLVTWTFAEYSLHRFLFHYPAKSRLGQRFVFLFHGVHHDTPRTRPGW